MFGIVVEMQGTKKKVYEPIIISTKKKKNVFEEKMKYGWF